MEITDEKLRIVYYGAVLNRDSSYIGSFFFGVRTTGIFCLPSCRARTPKFKNVVFFTDTKDLLDEGYRPCKLCRPTNYLNDTPIEVEKAMNLVFERWPSKVKDTDLSSSGIQPEMLRRWFKKHHGMTFQSYQRMIRLNTAFQELHQGEKVDQSAFGIGYESLSGFGYLCKTLTGKSPKEISSHKVINMDRISTPLGHMIIGVVDGAVCLLEFADRRMLEKQLFKIQSKLNAVILKGKNDMIDKAKIELLDYFEGKRCRFDLPLAELGNEMDKRVWKALREIPAGQTKTYSSIAKQLGISEKSVRKSNGENALAILTPCHRLLSDQGEHVGYGGGLARKNWLLRHESIMFKKQDDVLRGL
ncbi:bifunctional transcriptional activator/DNA repair enzyme AdaA [Aureibacter tunicatorum]|uniref:AraC family transcriptional regulator of adaptative response/methylated-DNA-[protein]-cysteine methyltransferase n=1 Tax=Aureibacter tunicatorum TaxID=866807 RepID=A0AAE3XLE2_9BACT|nr:methylated-DNA--[protein]-cysteine S-methyltransferase [Aureibacter tunicatorum]MDR6238124.1 AraC family transcriptional regulator of adaptative response/methylated-DNA-[protein]-cysteine methyltransferase [Aureibacter tunicatorum]BDD03157.1 XRE family transcriptional regulator [Aureibacter tunicatorum]